MDVEIEKPEIDQLPLHPSLKTSWPLLVTARYLGRQIRLHNLKGELRIRSAPYYSASTDVLKRI